MYVSWTSGDFMQQVALGTIESPTSWLPYIGGAVVKGVAMAAAGGASGGVGLKNKFLTVSASIWTLKVLRAT